MKHKLLCLIGRHHWEFIGAIFRIGKTMYRAECKFCGKIAQYEKS